MRRWAWVSRATWILLPVAFFVMCAGWALTSPPGSSPDDDYHLASIWCAAGVQDGRCELSPTDANARLVPRSVIDASACYRYDDAVDASCATAVRDDATLAETLRVNQTAGLYPGLYYRTMAVFVGSDVERSALSMRLFNAALASLLLALLIRVVPAGIRGAALLTVMVTFIPLGLFLVASTNPSGWAIVGLALFWAFALALLHRSDWRNRRTWLIAAAATLTAVMAAGARVDAAAFVPLTVIVVAVLAGWQRIRQAWVSAVVVGALGLLGVLTYLAFGTPGGVAGEAMGSAEPGGGLLLTNATLLPVLYQGVVGGWALGWNDTPLPPFVPIVGVLALGALGYVGLAHLRPRKIIAASLALVAMAAVPLAFLQKEGLGVGEVVQPRYVLPLLALLLATLLVGPRPGVGLPIARAPALTLAVTLSASAALALWVNAHRYFAGSNFGLFDPKVHPHWLNSAGLPLSLVVVATAVSGAAFVFGALRLSQPPRAGSRSGRLHP